MPQRDLDDKARVLTKPARGFGLGRVSASHERGGSASVGSSAARRWLHHRHPSAGG